ncbi:unnamed protein product [Polarella glacialis]|uniref:Uncharacterized protein n=1 Tax=Polarella glacialis TaxID=89957 RepID=A0A813DB28_POLGL|nr:unnamed protein product [Polarella glacialis]
MLSSLRQPAVLREHVRRSFQISTSVSLVCCSSNTSLPTCIAARRFAAKQPESAALLQRAALRRDKPQLQKTASNKRNRRFLLGLRNRITNLNTVCSTLAQYSSFTSTPEVAASQEQAKEHKASTFQTGRQESTQHPD